MHKHTKHIKKATQEFNSQKLAYNVFIFYSNNKKIYLSLANA